MNGFWMIAVLLLWLVPGAIWLWERGVFAGVSRRTSNRKLALFMPFFCLLLVYAQKPQNRPETPATSKRPTVAVVDKKLPANSKKAAPSQTIAKTVDTTAKVVTDVADTATTVATNTTTTETPETVATNTPGTVQRTLTGESPEQMSPELKLAGVVPISLTNSVWTDWTNGTEYTSWLTVPVRKAVVELDLPFEFPVGTNGFTKIYVTASGVIGFNQPYGSVVPEILPSEYGTNGVFLALAWGDNMFKPGLGSRLLYGSESNSFCVAMEQVFSGTNVFSAKAELFDNGNIVLKYRDLPADHTIGLQNRFGGWQVATNGTFEMFCRYFGWADPNKIDTDDDGLDDYDEIYVHGTNPRIPDTDGDGLSDSEEVGLGYNPMQADSNGDGLSDLLDSEGITITSDPLSISRVLDGYAADDQSYVPTPVISNSAILVTTRLDLPEGAAPVGTMVEVAGQMIPVLKGVTFSHSIALTPDSDTLIRYAPSNLPEGSSATIEIGAHRFVVLEDPSGVVTRFYSIFPEGEIQLGGTMFGLLTSPLPLPAPSGEAILNMPIIKIDPEVVCVHGTSRKANAVIEKPRRYDYFWTVSPSGEIDVDGGDEVEVSPGFPRSQTGALSVRAMPRFLRGAGDYLRTASAPLRFCPQVDEEQKQPGDEEYLLDPNYLGWPTNSLSYSKDFCPLHQCYYPMCPKEDFDHAHQGLPVNTNYTEAIVLQMDELKRYRTVAVSVPEPLTNCCPCPEHTGVYTWILPNWHLKVYDSPDLINETDRQERRDGYVYVTGVAPSKRFADAQLTIAPKTGDVLVHQFTVLGLQLLPDFDGDNTIFEQDIEKRKNGETWKLQASSEESHMIVFRTDVLLPFGMVKVSLAGAPAGTCLLDSEGEEICAAGEDYTQPLSAWRVEGEPALKPLYLKCPTPGSGEIAFEFMAVDAGQSYRCEKRQAFTAF